jgi:hypothetical protein
MSVVEVEYREERSSTIPEDSVNNIMSSMNSIEAKVGRHMLLELGPRSVTLTPTQVYFDC